MGVRVLSCWFRAALIPALVCASFLADALSAVAGERADGRRYLYVAVPGVRNYLEYGGHGLLVFDIDDGHRFVKRIATAGLDENGKPLNVKGICASADTDRVYISTLRTLISLDLRTEKLLWERAYEGGCDRMALSPDGRIIYLPSLEKSHWHVVDALTGEIIRKLVPPPTAPTTRSTGSTGGTLTWPGSGLRC